MHSFAPIAPISDLNFLLKIAEQFNNFLILNFCWILLDFAEFLLEFAKNLAKNFVSSISKPRNDPTPSGKINSIP